MKKCKCYLKEFEYVIFSVRLMVIFEVKKKKKRIKKQQKEIDK